MCYPQFQRYLLSWVNRDGVRYGRGSVDADKMREIANTLECEADAAENEHG
jgi:hypothetical protein